MPFLGHPVIARNNAAARKAPWKRAMNAASCHNGSVNHARCCVSMLRQSAPQIWLEDNLLTSPFVFAAVPRIREEESDIMIHYDKLWTIGGLTRSYPLPTIFWRTWLDFTVSKSCGTRCAKKLRWDTRRAQQRHLQKNLCQDVLQRHGDGEAGSFGQVLKVPSGNLT